MGLDPDPKLKSKGEMRREHILNTIKELYDSGKYHITVQEVQKHCGIRSFNTVTRHLLILNEQGKIEWNRTSSIIILNSNVHL